MSSKEDQPIKIEEGSHKNLIIATKTNNKKNIDNLRNLAKKIESTFIYIDPNKDRNKELIKKYESILSDHYKERDTLIFEIGEYESEDNDSILIGCNTAVYSKINNITSEKIKERYPYKSVRTFFCPSSLCSSSKVDKLTLDERKRKNIDSNFVNIFTSQYDNINELEPIFTSVFKSWMNSDKPKRIINLCRPKLYKVKAVDEFESVDLDDKITLLYGDLNKDHFNEMGIFIGISSLYSGDIEDEYMDDNSISQKIYYGNNGYCFIKKEFGYDKKEFKVYPDQMNEDELVCADDKDIIDLNIFLNKSPFIFKEIDDDIILKYYQT